MARTTICVLGVMMWLCFATTAFAEETWNCKYKGAWETTATKNHGVFTWEVKWEKTPEGWRVIGDYDDHYGKSFLDGTCAKRQCGFVQTYQSGELEGKTYYWLGAYSEAWEGERKTLHSFTGTWGYTEDRPDSGTWKATGTCLKN